LRGCCAAGAELERRMPREGVEVSIGSAGYPGGAAVLRNVSFTLRRGELLLIAGPSGSGKTTLILALTGVLTNLLGGFVEGLVRLFGVDPLTPEGFVEVPRLVGVVLQDTDKQIAMPYPIDEVAFTLRNLGVGRYLEEAMRALDEVGLRHKAFTETESLSGGEKKRLCVAASIAHRPPLLIFDEPTANLDPRGVSRAVRYVREFVARGHAVIVIEHKARYFIDLADRILVLDEGRVAARFTRRDVESSRKGVMHSLESFGVDASPPRRGPTPLEAPRGPTAIEARGLWYCYENGVCALRGIDLEVPRRSVFAVVGHNGSGKTTLLKVLTGLYRPTRGWVRVEGRDPSALGRFERPRTVFYVPQEPDYLFTSPRVEDEFRLVSEAVGRSVDALLRVFGLEELRGRIPYTLSHGQRRWLALSIARGYEPRIILLDEPTAGLDLRLFKELVRWVEESVASGATVVVATHDPRLVAEAATDAVVVEEGRVVGRGVEAAIQYLEGALG